MKKFLAILLIIVILSLTACTAVPPPSYTIPDWDDAGESMPDFSGLSDPTLTSYLEDAVYASLVKELNSADYFVENVSAIYISKEYLEDLEYNSRENVFFGYKLSELNELFEGTRYIFTLGDDGKTTVEPFEAYDDTYEKALLKTAVGAGVILLCATVSFVTAGAGAPAVSLIFAASAKSAAIMGASSGLMGGLVAGIGTGIQTGDFEEALKSAATAGSEGFAWGAIGGAISGGVTAGTKYAEAMKALKGVDLKGLTKQQAAAIQMESGFPVDVIKEFDSMEQYNICKSAKLSPKMINGKTSLVREIDLDYKDKSGLTNLQRMQKGDSPLDPNGIAYELHHIGQKPDSTLAVLTQIEHRQEGNFNIWHTYEGNSLVHGSGSNWNTLRSQYWKQYAKIAIGAA